MKKKRGGIALIFNFRAANALTPQNMLSNPYVIEATRDLEETARIFELKNTICSLGYNNPYDAMHEKPALFMTWEDAETYEEQFILFFTKRYCQNQPVTIIAQQIDTQHMQDLLSKRFEKKYHLCAPSFNN